MSARRVLTPPPVTPEDVLEELSQSATLLLKNQEIISEHVQDPAAHGLHNDDSPLRQIITKEALRIHNASGVNEAQKDLADRVTSAEGDIDALQHSVRNPTTATSDTAGAVKPDSVTIIVQEGGALSVNASVPPVPDTIVQRNAEGKMEGSITGTAVYA